MYLHLSVVVDFQPWWESETIIIIDLGIPPFKCEDHGFQMDLVFCRGGDE